jgi:hypothetical protein
MIATTALTLLLLAGAPPAADGPGRLLLCRPRVLGDAALANAAAVPAAARALPGRFLDYGVACEDLAEASRAARRAGLDLALTSIAEGGAGGARYVLSLSAAAEEREVSRREVSVAAGQDAVPPLETALRELVASARGPERAPPRASSRGPWLAVGAGAAVLLAGGGFALAAGSDARARDRAGTAGDYRTYVEKDVSWRRWRTASGVALGVGGAALAAGAVWRFAF